MNVALCDDKSEELAALRSLVALWQDKNPELPLRVKSFSSAVTMIDEAKREHFDLYILDVVMPGMDGISAAREIRSFDDAAEIVFLSSSTDFAFESYGVHALNYLLKPVRETALFPVLNKLSAREKQNSQGLVLKCSSTYVRVLFSQLSFVEVSGKHLFFNLIDGSVRQVYGSLNEYEAQLLIRPEFMRIHRSYIVNMYQIAEMSSSGVRTFSGHNLPVSRTYYPQLQEDYMKLLFNRGEE